MHSRPVSRALTSTAVALTLLGLSGGSAGALELTGSPGSAGSGDSILPAWGNGGYDARHYDIDLSWRADSRTVDARTTVTAVATQNLSRFNLELRGFAVDGVTVKVGDVRQPATVRRDGAEMTVDPPVDIAKGQTFRTTVSYSGKPSARVIKHLGKTGWLSTSDGATALSEPLGSETWFPVNNTIRDKATYAIDVEVPNRLMAASNGRFAGRDVGDTRTTWKWREADPMAPYLPTVSIGRYRMFRSAMDHGRIPLVTFVDTKLGRQAEARRTLPRVLRFLERTFGRYPFQSSGMIIDRIDVGYALETQSRPVMPFRAPSYLITHEIAHQWVGELGDAAGLEGHLAQRGLRDVHRVVVGRRALRQAGHPAAAVRLPVRDLRPEVELLGDPAGEPRLGEQAVRAPGLQPRRDGAAGAPDADRQPRLPDRPAPLGPAERRAHRDHR